MIGYKCAILPRYLRGAFTGARRRMSWVRLPLVFAIFVLVAMDARSQDVLTYDNFSSFVLGGTAQREGASLLLTTTVGQAGTGFLPQPIQLGDMGSFSAAFSFAISDPSGITDTDGIQGADGITFAIHTKAGGVGLIGGGIGYQGLSPSIGIEFDTWNNGYEDGNDGNHVGIDINGSTGSILRRPVQAPLNDGSTWYAWVDFDGATNALEVRLSKDALRPPSPLLNHSIYSRNRT